MSDVSIAMAGLLAASQMPQVRAYLVVRIQ